MHSNIHVNPRGPLAGLLTPPDKVNATEHPNRSRYFNGNMPPPDLFRPHGALVAVQIYRDAEGKTAETPLVMPDAVKEAWTTPLYVVVARGPEAKFVEVGDVVGVPTEVRFQVFRIDGWELLVMHEQQSSGTIPRRRINPQQLPEGFVPSIASGAPKHAEPESTS